MKNKPFENTTHLESENKILTIPNLLSAFRLCLIPIFVWLYCVEKNYFWTGGILILSGFTDLIDGFIARRFHMISNVGKVLDPVADKLTQGAMLFCLISRFPLMLAALVLLIVKEIIAAVVGLLVIRKTGKVFGAKWHGKAATCVLYAMMIIHVFWSNIPKSISTGLIIICISMMTISLVLYSVLNFSLLNKQEVRG